jgi:hypothetical protein
MIASFLMAEYSHKGKRNMVSTGRLFSFMSGEFPVVSDGGSYKSDIFLMDLAERVGFELTAITGSSLFKAARLRPTLAPLR